MKCKIQLDRYQAIFYTGDHITGSVSLIPEKLDFIEAIDIIFHGETDIEWYALNKPPSIIHNDSSSKELDEWKIKFYGYQTHFNYNKRLSENIELNNQEEEYKFYYNISLPNDLPCSNGQKYGRTIFKLKIQLSYQKLTSKIYEREICIRKHLDLRLLKHLHLPFAIHEHLNDYEFCFDIPSTGYTPGQRIPYQAKLFGIGNKNVQINVALNCFIKYQALQPYPNQKIEKKCLMLHVKNCNELITSFLQIPLTTEISTECNLQQQMQQLQLQEKQQQQQEQQQEQQQYLINITYNLEICLVNSTSNDILRTYKIDLIIGTKPCYINENVAIEEEAGVLNLGSSIEEVFIDETFL